VIESDGPALRVLLSVRIWMDLKRLYP